MTSHSEIKVTCHGADNLPIDRILEFQGNLKKITKENLDKLKKAILKYGFTAPLFVWDDHGDYRLLDGHQRLKALLKMREEGYTIPMIPVDYIEAEDEAEAKAKLLHITSQYGEFSTEGFMDFTDGLEFDFEGIRLTDGEFNIDYSIPDENKEIDEESFLNTDNECPKCGFKW